MYPPRGAIKALTQEAVDSRCRASWHDRLLLRCRVDRVEFFVAEPIKAVAPARAAREAGRPA